MRNRAQNMGKTVPSKEALLALIDKLISQGMKCIGCDRVMRWLGNKGESSLVTLQHDRNGDFRLICLGCNTRHAYHPGDTFYDVKPGEKICNGCGKVKGVSEFNKDLTRPGGLRSCCRDCQKIRNARRNRKAVAS
jgi:hypothetical protein